MKVATTRAELFAVRNVLAGRVALVPTMGALHEGHRALLRHAHEAAEHVVVSIFVNPLQFGENEDLDRYPHTLEADLAMCEAEGVAVVFAPSRAEVYPREPRVTVHAGAIGEVFEGASRPGHFDGVLTVVAKLFGLVRPDAAVFGHKDAQQLALVRAMAADLDLGVEIVAVPTVREPDGLALSSRNRYLSDDERSSALLLSRALRTGAARAEVSGADLASIEAAAREILDAENGIALDYLALVDPDTFAAASALPALLAVAARVGSTRLIDNVLIEKG